VTGSVDSRAIVGLAQAVHNGGVVLVVGDLAGALVPGLSLLVLTRCWLKGLLLLENLRVIWDTDLGMQLLMERLEGWPIRYELGIQIWMKWMRR
jgi:hypothetical protein